MDELTYLENKDRLKALELEISNLQNEKAGLETEIINFETAFIARPESTAVIVEYLGEDQVIVVGEGYYVITRKVAGNE